jgi:hypothetical protein
MATVIERSSIGIRTFPIGELEGSLPPAPTVGEEGGDDKAELVVGEGWIAAGDIEAALGESAGRSLHAATPRKRTTTSASDLR